MLVLAVHVQPKKQKQSLKNAGPDELTRRGCLYFGAERTNPGGPDVLYGDAKQETASAGSQGTGGRTIIYHKTRVATILPRHSRIVDEWSEKNIVAQRLSQRIHVPSPQPQVSRAIDIHPSA